MEDQITAAKKDYFTIHLVFSFPFFFFCKDIYGNMGQKEKINRKYLMHENQQIK